MNSKLSSLWATPRSRARSLGGLALIATLVPLSLAIANSAGAAATAVPLGTTAGFAILAGSGVSDTPPSVISGNVGLSPASGSYYTGLTSAEVSGTIYAVDAAGPANSVNNPGLLTNAKNDLTTAYNDAAAEVPNSTITADLGGQTLVAGVYQSGSSIGLTGTLTLNAAGNPNAVFVFQAPSSTLTTAAASDVVLENGAQACNVFWQVGSSATLGTGSTFAGTILAATSISLNSSVTVSGQLLASTGAVTLIADTIAVPACTTATTTTTAPVTTTTIATTASTTSPVNTAAVNKAAAKAAAAAAARRAAAALAAKTTTTTTPTAPESPLAISTVKVTG